MCELATQKVHLQCRLFHHLPTPYHLPGPPLPKHLLQWNEPRRMRSTDTRPTMLDRFAITRFSLEVDGLELDHTYYEILNSPK